MDLFKVQINVHEDKWHNFGVGSTANKTNLQEQINKDLFVITDEVRNFLEQEENSSQLDQLRNIQELILLNSYGYDISFPKAKIYLSTEKTIMLAWASKKHFFGVSIFPEREESCWTLIERGKNSRGFGWDGYLNDTDFTKYLWMIIELMKK